MKIFKPLGSHPLLDPYYVGADLWIRHVGMTLSRLDKARVVADWAVDLQNLIVCKPAWPGDNCGRCEKCIRTDVSTPRNRHVGQDKGFPCDDISSELILENVRFAKPAKKDDYTFEDNYMELLPFLKKVVMT
jgi:hypothetical protein